MLREQLGDQVKITDAEVAEQQRSAGPAGRQARISGRRNLHPGGRSRATAADAQRFAETVISELRAGAAVPGGCRAVQPEPDGAAGWRAGLGAAQPARSRGGTPGRRNAGRRDQQSGEGAWRHLHRERCRASARSAATSARRCRCARCSCRSPARSIRRRRPSSRSRRWRRRAASVPACTAASRWSRPRRPTTRRGPPDPGEVRLETRQSAGIPPGAGEPAVRPRQPAAGDE